MIVCGCPLHDNRNGVDVCTCLCQEHDTFFDQGVVLVRQAVRRNQRVMHDEIKGVHNRLNAVNQLYDTVSADLSRLRQEAREVASRVTAIEERLSPPDKATGPKVEDIATFAEGRDLPPDKWDRYGVRWRAKRRTLSENDFRWESVPSQFAFAPKTLTGKELEERGPFTETSPLAEDQEPLPDAGEAKDADPDDEDGEWINLHAFVPGTVTAEKCEVCGGPADGLLHEQPRGSDLWSTPWEPQVEPSDSNPLYTAVRQAVNDAAVSVRDTEKEQWVAAGLVRWIEKRYQLFDQPAYQGKTTRSQVTASPAFDAMQREDGKERLHSESDRKSCMSCHKSAVDCDRSRTYNSKACCGFCEVETYKVAHPVRRQHVTVQKRPTEAIIGPASPPVADIVESDDEHYFKATGRMRERAERAEARADEASSTLEATIHERDSLRDRIGQLEADNAALRKRLGDWANAPQQRRPVRLTSVRTMVHADIDKTPKVSPYDRACGCRYSDDKQWITLCDEHDHWQQTGMRQPEDMRARLAAEAGWYVQDKPEETSGGPLRRERESDGDMLARLGTDAVKWADRFVALFQGMMVGRDSQVDEGLMLPWFASAIGAGESKHAVELDYLAYLAGRHYPEKARDWFENYYGTDAYKPPRPGGLIANWAEKLSKTRDALVEIKKNFASAPDGWFPFGTHAAVDGVRLEFWGSDEAGTPIFERPVTTDEVALRQPREGENIG